MFDNRIEGEIYSAVLAFSVLLFTDDPAKTLARMNDLLSSGGLLISQTPCLSERPWFFRLLIVFFQKIGVVPPIVSFSINELEKLVSNSGFEIVETKIWHKNHAVQWIVAKKT